jgi:hypothetical protein
LAAAREGVRSEPAFFGYLGSATVFRLGMNMPSALYSVFWVHHLRLSDAQIAMVATLNYAFTILGYYVWTKLASRRGRGLVMAASCLGLATYPLLTALAHSVGLVYFTGVVGGLFSAESTWRSWMCWRRRRGRRSTYVGPIAAPNSVALMAHARITARRRRRTRGVARRFRYALSRRRPLRRSAGASAPRIAACSSLAPGAISMSRPNILLIHSDQHRADCLGVAGHPLIETPNLDGLAREGVRFTHAFTLPTCVRRELACLSTLAGSTWRLPPTLKRRALAVRCPIQRALRAADTASASAKGRAPRRRCRLWLTNTCRPAAMRAGAGPARCRCPTATAFGESDPGVAPEQSGMAWGAEDDREGPLATGGEPFLRWDQWTAPAQRRARPYASMYSPADILRLSAIPAASLSAAAATQLEDRR